MIRGRIKDEKGITLIDMLIGILIFILASVLIISVVGKAIDKPKVAGIKGALKYYEAGASLLLHEVANVPDKVTLLPELNRGLDEVAKFTDGNSTLTNAYNNQYKAEVIQTDKQTAIVVETQGKNAREKYRVVVIKEGEIVESCTVGFGRNDKGLATLKSDLCEGKPVIDDDKEEEEEGILIEDLPKGNQIWYAGMWWTLLDPETRYIHLNVGQELGAESVWFANNNRNVFNTIDSDNIGYWLNTGWYGGLSDEDKWFPEERNWGIGKLSRDEGGIFNQIPTLTPDKMRNKEDSVLVKAKIGLLSVSEYRQYSKYYGKGAGVIDYGNVNNEWMWLRTPLDDDNPYEQMVWDINNYMLNPTYGSNRKLSRRVRPALNFKSDTRIAPDGTLLRGKEESPK